MAEVKKARLFLRRGTDTDRKTTTLCEGELGYSTDAFRVVVGDGSTAGGRSLGTTTHVSGGLLGHQFHTKLVQASAYPTANGTGGFALQGDLAVFPASAYKAADGVTTRNILHASATVCMLLTGTDATVGSSWVSINSGIPFGNIDVQSDDITGDYISGGDISGDVTFSGTISTTSMSGGSAFVVGMKGTGNRNVVVTAGGQLSANTDSVAFADGTLKFLSSPVTISTTQAASAGPTTDFYSDGSTDFWFTYTNPTGVPKTATGGLFQFVWPGHATKATAGKQHLFEMRKCLGATALSAAYERASTSTGETAGGSVQITCPLSGHTDGSVKFQYRLRQTDEANPSTAVFNNGHTITMIGYV